MIFPLIREDGPALLMPQARRLPIRILIIVAFQTSWFFSAVTETPYPCPQTPAIITPGEIVTWNLGGGITHIGMVVDQKSPRSGRYLVVHNIGRGPQMEDVLFDWKIIGHYRYLGERTGSQ
jgi:uncharacterized protein YijF (DUF1287 family)